MTAAHPLARLALTWPLALVFSAQQAAAGPPTLRNGDIVFQTSRSSQSLAVQRATRSPFSHMGLVLFRDGKPWVFEAVATVRFTPLDQWTKRGTGGHFVVKRLNNADEVLTPAAVEKLRASASAFQGRPYDLAFGWSDDRLYCSELVWKAYQRSVGIEIGTLQHLRDFNLSDPVVRAKMRERYGDKVPLDEIVIAPAAMFDSPNLITVEQR